MTWPVAAESEGTKKKKKKKVVHKQMFSAYQPPTSSASDLGLDASCFSMRMTPMACIMNRELHAPSIFKTLVSSDKVKSCNRECYECVI